MSGLSGFLVAAACGRSIAILWVISGAVIMKMISSTSITSTIGVTLISDIGGLSEVKLLLPLLEKAMSCRGHGPLLLDPRAGGQVLVQVVREVVEALDHDAVAAHQEVVAE